jgi:hypothetical protein
MRKSTDHPCYTAVDLQGGVVAVHASARVMVKPRPPLARLQSELHLYSLYNERGC